MVGKSVDIPEEKPHNYRKLFFNELDFGNYRKWPLILEEVSTKFNVFSFLRFA